MHTSHPAVSDQAEYERMANAPVGGLILNLAVPTMVTTLIMSIYNMADTFFVGRIGTSATAAVGVVFSVVMVLNGLGFWFGTGASSLVSRMLGARENRHADVITSTAFFMALAVGLVVAVVCLAIGEPLMILLGATETMLPYTMAYGRFIFMAAPFCVGSLVLSKGLCAEGKSKESMVGQVTGGVLNMILDPLFIFAFDWGITGAAAATALSQVVAFVIQLSYYLRGKTQVHISFRLVSKKMADYRDILVMGFPSLCRHCCNMVANVVLNWTAGVWGDAAIAAMSIAGRMLYLANAVSSGMNQGSQPVIGFAHGMGNQKRVRQAFWFAVKVSVASMCAFAVVGIAFAPQLIGLFRDDELVIAYGATALRLICVALPFANFMNSSSLLFQVVGKPVPSSLLIFGRQLIFYIPMLLILPRVIGILGVQIAGPAADIITFCIALPMVLRYFKSTQTAQA